ncbi:MAG: hypothetical protein QM278_00980 [Pseudomonadota bacterium]|nr:hypothetical protein [Pseudomonadota bacterium]
MSGRRLPLVERRFPGPAPRRGRHPELELELERERDDFTLMIED